MDSIIHEHLNKLRLISIITDGMKLSIVNVKDIKIYRDNAINWICRKYNNDSKEKTLKFLQDLYKDISHTSNNIVVQIGAIQNKKYDITHNNEYVEKISIAINMCEKLKTSIVGIEGLSKTYSAFPEITSSLEGVVQDYAVPTYKKLLDIIPDTHKTQYLCTNIVYNGMTLYKTHETEETKN